MEHLNEGLAVTVIGMGTVFSVLILLWILLEGMRIVFYKPEVKAPVTVEKPEVKQEVIQQPAVSTEELDELDEDELIAVLTAAVASSLNQSTYNLNIKSFRRIEQTSPIWNTVSRKEQLESRL
ncbi:OadG family protein [Petroclostridium xylanilyticum]|uniref:OadG family protein n=1 Tax=Petroclostridium xylanilyticum TaxID=1792311 RepID=UPI000B97E079|nr:OadG family protein [Petroclostridium xylanilyticum]